MLRVELSAGERIAFAIPQPVAVKFDQIAIRGWRSLDAAFIYYIDFSAMPAECLELKPVHLEYARSKVDGARYVESVTTVPTYSSCAQGPSNPSCQTGRG